MTLKANKPEKAPAKKQVSYSRSFLEHMKTARNDFTLPQNFYKLSEQDMRKEYTKLSKIANKRISAIEKAGMYSYSIESQKENGITKFGVKNEQITNLKDLKKAYKNIVEFLNTDSSSKTGIKKLVSDLSRNFNIPFDGNYAEFTQKSKKIFDLYKDFKEFAKKGNLKDYDRYDVIEDLSILQETGFITEETTIGELKDQLTKMFDLRVSENRAHSRQATFQYQ